MAGNHDRLARILNGVDALHEQDRVLGDLGVGLLGVAPVVETDAQDLLDLDRRQQALDVGGLPGDRVVAEDVAFDLQDAFALFGSVVRAARAVEITNDLHVERISFQIDPPG